jgi:hypothetical protein
VSGKIDCLCSGVLTFEARCFILMKLAAVRFAITQRAVCGCRAEEGFTRGRYDSLVERVTKGDGWQARYGRTDGRTVATLSARDLIECSTGSCCSLGIKGNGFDYRLYFKFLF